MGMSAGGSKKGAQSDINVTPLVDICLVLLIIFMVMLPKNVPVELNRRLLRSEKYSVPLTEGDAIEIVTFVGGG